MAATPPRDPPVTELPVYWFAILDGATARGDLQRAIDAQRQLERLGVRVRYGRPRQARPADGGPHHAA
jgi:hypothetical protein